MTVTHVFGRTHTHPALMMTLPMVIVTQQRRCKLTSFRHENSRLSRCRLIILNAKTQHQIWYNTHHQMLEPTCTRPYCNVPRAFVYYGVVVVIIITRTLLSRDSSSSRRRRRRCPAFRSFGRCNVAWERRSPTSNGVFSIPRSVCATRFDWTRLTRTVNFILVCSQHYYLFWYQREVSSVWNVPYYTGSFSPVFTVLNNIPSRFVVVVGCWYSLFARC